MQRVFEIKLREDLLGVAERYLRSRYLAVRLLVGSQRKLSASPVTRAAVKAVLVIVLARFTPTPLPFIEGPVAGGEPESATGA